MLVNLEFARGSQPLYVQLANALEQHIRREALQPGELLPSETTLTAETGLSRATILKAYELLSDRGQISRRQGKGTFVRERPMERMLPDLNSFSEHVHDLGLSPSNTLLSFTSFARQAKGRPDVPLLDDAAIVVIERIRHVDGRPVGIQRLVVPAQVAARINLDEKMAAQATFSFYAALREHDIALRTGHESLRAINADAREATQLGVPKGTALIEVTRESRDGAGNLVEVIRARYLGSKYLYQITLAPSTGGTNEVTNEAFSRAGGGLDAAALGMRD